MTTRAWLFRLLVPTLWGMASYAWSIERCDSPIARIVSVQGHADVTWLGQPRWRPVKLEDTFCPGDSVRIDAHGRAAVLLADDTLLRLDQGTTITFSPPVAAEPSWLELVKGAFYFISRVPRTLKIRTPFVNAAIEGTEFVVRVDATETAIWVLEGRVLATNRRGNLVLTAGEAGFARPGQAPQRRVVIRPRDAVHWALYYPPIIDFSAAEYPSGTAREALARYHDNDLPGALARLEGVSPRDRDSKFFTLRAGLLLTVGRVDEAEPDIDKAVSLDARNASALALRSVIAVTRNDNELALDLAEQAAALDPRSPVPRIGLSYAYQATFQIEKALESAQYAADLDPGNALAWARVSELQLSLGDLGHALDAAQRAAASNPDLGRTQTVLGFANLTRIQIDEARIAFERAIELDPASPLPRLGLGLAKIRRNDLAEGRREIQIAASLDPGNSLIRSYLGKAYYEEKRDPLAAKELAIAKELDPKDPTPWLYDAIRKQTINRPVEALHDLQKSIELNSTLR